MPESLFGHPSTLLTQATSQVPTMPTFNTVQEGAIPAPKLEQLFSTIAKQPVLLSRISQADAATPGYSSPSPSPVPSSSILLNEIAPAQLSRPSLLQQLTGVSNDGIPHTSLPVAAPALSNGPSSLRSRLDSAASIPPAEVLLRAILMSPRKDTAAFLDAPRNATLIPPIEILPQASERDPGCSSPSQPHSGSLEAALNRVQPILPQLTTDGNPQSQVAEPQPHVLPAQRTGTMRDGTPSIAVNPHELPASHLSSVPPKQLPDSALPALMLPNSSPELKSRLSPLPDGDASQQPLKSVSSLPDPLDKCRACLVALKNDLASMPLSSSSSPTPPSVAQPTSNHDASYQQSQSGGIQPFHAHRLQDSLPPDDSSCLTVSGNTNAVTFSTIPQGPMVPQEFQPHTNRILDAVHNLTLALSSAHRSHVEVENTLVEKQRTLDDERSTFEQKKQADEAAYQVQLEELTKLRSDLREQGSKLAALEVEHQVSEEARRAVYAQRQAQEAKKQAEVEARILEMGDRVAAALKEVEELRVQDAKSRVERQCPPSTMSLQAFPMDVHLPFEVPEGMNDEAAQLIKKRKVLLNLLENDRRTYEQRTRALEEATSALRRLQEERKRDIEVECQQAVEGAHQNALSEEMERASRSNSEGRKPTAVNVEQEQPVVIPAKHPLQATSDSTPLLDAPKPSVQAQMPQTLSPLTSSSTELERQRRQEVLARKRAEVMTLKQRVSAENAAKIRAGHEDSSTVFVENKRSADGALSIPESTRTPCTGSTSPSPQAARKTAPSSTNEKNNANFGKAPSFVSASTDAGRLVATDAPLFPVQLASELNTASSANAQSYRAITPPPKSSNSTPRTPLESNTQSLKLAPQPHVSPMQHNVNLRHVKGARQIENSNGDRSVREGNARIEEGVSRSIKKESSLERPLLFQGDEKQPSKNIATSSSEISRPSVIPPPRPKKRVQVPVLTQATSSPDAQPRSSVQNMIGEMGDNAQQPTSQPQRDSPTPWVMDASHSSGQEWAPRPNLLSPPPIDIEQRPTHSGINESALPPRRCTNNGGQALLERIKQHEGALATSPDDASRSPDHPVVVQELDRDDRDREDRRRPKNLGEEWIGTHRRESDHWSPPRARTSLRPVSPKGQIYGDRWVPPPMAGKRRRSGSFDDEHSARPRRPRGDTYVPECPLGSSIAQSTNYRRSPSAERHGIMRGSHYRPSDAYMPSPPSPVIPARENPLSRNAPRDSFGPHATDPDAYHRSERALAVSPPVRDQYHPLQEQDAEPHVANAQDQHDPSLLTRMSDTQRFPVRVSGIIQIDAETTVAQPSENGMRGRGAGRGRGMPGRGGSDHGRGRGEPRGQGGVALLKRLRAVPSLETRLT